ncbi:MAG TPA: sigma-70 family RNA polymerase sigma factor [Sandaracinaceae bacterium LLY-WYZ-13_1]|nr:sigma-70 family RNA polymerase sigma factor [Sandaracinaceae bacterium LLY-WYZ-13_1]
MGDDRAQLAAWRAGDAEAGQALVERHYESVLRFFRTKAGEDADDLVQQTFLRAVEHAERFRGESSFRGFLFGIARNVLFEHIRRKRRDGRRDCDFGVSSILDLNPRASTILVQRAEERALVQALQRMPVEIQIVLELYYWEELSVGDVAAAVEVPAGTVKSRLHRGRTLLRQAMKKTPSRLTGARSDDGGPSLARWLARDERPAD